MNRLRRILGAVAAAARWIVKMERVGKETRERGRCHECGAGAGDSVYLLGPRCCPHGEGAK